MESLVEVYVSEQGKTHIMLWASDEKLFDNPKVLAGVTRPLRRKLSGLKIKVERMQGVLIGVQYALYLNGKLGITPKIAFLHLLFQGLETYGFHVKHSMGHSSVPKFLLSREDCLDPDAEEEDDDHGGSFVEDIESELGTSRRKSMRDIFGRRKSSRDSSSSESSY